MALQQQAPSYQQQCNRPSKRAQPSSMALSANKRPRVSSPGPSTQAVTYDEDEPTIFESSPPTTPEPSHIGPSRQSSLASSTSSASSLPLSLFELEFEEPTPVRVIKKGIRVPNSTTKATAVNRIKAVIKNYKTFYRYSPIPNHQVRLLIIKPGAPEDVIHVTLLAVDDVLLGSAEFPYKALSYHWGDGKADKEIVVQDGPTAQPVKNWDDLLKGVLDGKEKKKAIKPNLYEALKHLRHSDKLVSAWVDALCIDQDSEAEKNEQVKKMPTIYRNAYNVVIWLGSDEADNSSSAMAMKFIPQAIDPERHEELLNDDGKIPYWASLFELLKWSWFSRRWIIQELALAKRATVHCGDNKPIHWNDFQDAIAIFCRDFDILKPKLRLHFERTNHPDKSKWNSDSDFEIGQLGAKLLVDITSNLFRRNVDGSSESTYGLEKLVCLLSGFEASDPRDTINALINISSEVHRNNTDQALAIPASDYRKDLFDVYRGFVEWVVKTSKSLDIICRHWALPEREQDRPLPSWIKSADDSAFGRGHDVFEGRKAGGSFVGLPGTSRYHASGRGHEQKYPEVHWPAVVAPHLDKTLHDMAIIVTGLAIGTVLFRTEPFPDSIITKPCLERLGWSFKKKHTEVVEVPNQLWQTLVADHGPNGTPMPPLYRRACQYVMVNLTRNGHINIDNLLRRTTGYTKDYLERVRAVTWDRSFIEGVPRLPTKSTPLDATAKKLVGLGPPKTRENDVIAILYGCSVPVILRPIYDSMGKVEAHQFVGEAFIYGKMDGEAFHGGHEEIKFRLI